MVKKVLFIGIGAAATVGVLIIGLVLGIVLLGGSDDDRGGSRSFTVTRSAITNSGLNSFPMVDGRNVYWITEGKEIFTYYVDKKTTEKVYTHTTDNETMGYAVASDGHIVVVVYHSDPLNVFNISKTLRLFDVSSKTLRNLNVDGYGPDLDYPYLVYHDLKTNLYLMDIDSGDTKVIAHANWGNIDGKKVCYTVDDSQTHIYDIDTGTDEMVYKTGVDHVDIYLAGGKCHISETEDFGIPAETTVFCYDMERKKMDEVGKYGDYIFNEASTGGYLFFFDSDKGEVCVMDLESGSTKTVAGGQKFASLATGSIDAQGNIAAWSSDKQIQIATMK